MFRMIELYGELNSMFFSWNILFSNKISYFDFLSVFFNELEFGTI